MRRCDTCRTLWLDPAPVGETLAAAYANYHTHTAPQRRGVVARLAEASRQAYLRDTSGYPHARATDRLVALPTAVWPARREIASYSVLGVPWVAGGRLLDVGCGDGRAAADIAAMGWTVTGIDNDPEAVEAAATRGIEARVGVLDDISFAESTFDVVVLRHAVEHLPSPGATLCAARRVVVPDGLVVIATPNAGSLLHRRYGRDWRGLEPPRHLQVFTRRGLEALAHSAGLEVTLSRTSSRGATELADASRSIAGGGSDDGRTRRRRFRIETIEERFALRRDPDAGEEIWLHARPGFTDPRHERSSEASARRSAGPT